MKTYFKILAVASIISLGATSCYVSQSSVQPYEESYTQQQEISFNVFYHELSPYGRWVDYPQYGRVWVANEAGFMPYQTGGHWVYSSYGWTWASDYNWGWAPFHYGRWANDPFYGWFWVPGYEWAPAWVSWRSGGGYYGWAPLSPGFNINIGASFGSIPREHWCFVPNQYMGNGNMRNYYVNRSNNITIINNTRIINNTNEYRGTRYLQGPDRREVEINSGQRITPVEIRDANRPGQSVNNNNITVYRPRVNRNDDGTVAPGNNGNTQRQVQPNPARREPPAQQAVMPRQMPVTVPPSGNPHDNRPIPPTQRPVVPQPQQPIPVPVNPMPRQIEPRSTTPPDERRSPETQRPMPVYPSPRQQQPSPERRPVMESPLPTIPQPVRNEPVKREEKHDIP